MTINLLWPTWARIAERWSSAFAVASMRRWVVVRRAAVLLVRRLEAANDARFARLAWSSGGRPVFLAKPSRVRRTFRIMKGGAA